MIIFRVTQVCCWACFWYHWWYQLPWLQWCQALVCVSVAAWVTVGFTPWSPLCSEEELEELWVSYMCLDRWATRFCISYIAYSLGARFTVLQFDGSHVSCWQCVAGAMYITGFAESIAQVLNLQSMWLVRGISVAVLIGLLGINLAGVKWIVRPSVGSTGHISYVHFGFRHRDIQSSRPRWAIVNANKITSRVIQIRVLVSVTAVHMKVQLCLVFSNLSLSLKQQHRSPIE